jgi:hypothetical protein
MPLKIKIFAWVCISDRIQVTAGLKDGIAIFQSPYLSQLCYHASICDVVDSVVALSVDKLCGIYNPSRYIW